MATDRMTRVNELLKREIGAFLFRMPNEDSFDVAAVTVTQVTTRPNLREARVQVSVRGEPGEPERVLRILQDRRAEFQAAIARHVKIKYTPRLLFELDASIQKGDRMLRLLQELEAEERVATDAADGEAGADPEGKGNRA